MNNITSRTKKGRMLNGFSWFYYINKNNYWREEERKRYGCSSAFKILQIYSDRLDRLDRLIDR